MRFGSMDSLDDNWHGLFPLFGDVDDCLLPESLGVEALASSPQQDEAMSGNCFLHEAGDFEDPMPSGNKMGEPQHWEGEGQAEVVIYDKSSESCNCYKPHMQESAKILSRTFRTPGRMDDMQPSLAQVLRDVSYSTNYEVQEVVRIQNRQRYGMHMHFKRIYDIDAASIVYHGTTRASAASIASTGFRGAVSQRAKFGKGIYCASNLWEALAYAEPDRPALTQTILVVEMLQGPTTLGRQDQVDFGVDAAGKEILTTTNAEHTIFCAKYENQLLATYRITVRYLSDRLHTPNHYNSVGMYHPTIWKIIKEQTPAAGRKSPHPRSLQRGPRQRRLRRRPEI